MTAGSLPSVEPVATDLGPARMFVALPERARAVLLLGHGAGGGVDAPDLVALTRLTEEGFAVLRFEQPWRTAGKRIAPAPARLDVGWRAARQYARTRFPNSPLVLGGRSAGARVACRSAVRDHAAEVLAVVALSFPLHPPGKPSSSRSAELLGPACPVLVVQGERDPFGTPAEIDSVIAAAPRHRVVGVPGCAHEFKPAKRGPLSEAEVAEVLAATVASFVDEIRSRGNPGPNGRE